MNTTPADSNMEGNDHQTSTVRLTFAIVVLAWYVILWSIALIGWNTA